MTTATASARQKLVDRIKECIKAGKVEFHGDERINTFACSVYGANGQPLFFSSVAKTRVVRAPSEWGPEVDSHETDYALSICGDGKGMAAPVLVLKSSDGDCSPFHAQHEAREVHGLLVAFREAELKKAEESRKKLSSDQEEMVAGRLLQELDWDPANNQDTTP